MGLADGLLTPRRVVLGDGQHHVEGPAGLCDVDVVVREEIEQHVPALLERGAHLRDRVAGVFERLDAGVLDEVRGAGDRVGVEFPGLVDQFLGGGEVAQPPARHRVGLREAVDRDRAFLHVRERPQRDGRFAVRHLPVDLVGDDGHVVLDGEVAHGLHGIVGVHRPGRVRGSVHDEHLGLVAHGFGEVLERGFEREVVSSEVDPREVAPREFHHRLVGHPRRVQQDDLVAGPDERLDRLVEGLLAPGRDDEVLRAVAEATVAEVVGDGLPECRDPVGGGVAVVAGVECVLRGVDDVRGRLEVRFADAQVDDVHSLRLQL